MARSRAKHNAPRQAPGPHKAMPPKVKAEVTWSTCRRRGDTEDVGGLLCHGIVLSTMACTARSRPAGSRPAPWSLDTSLFQEGKSQQVKRTCAVTQESQTNAPPLHWRCMSLMTASGARLGPAPDRQINGEVPKICGCGFAILHLFLKPVGKYGYKNMIELL